VALQSLRVVLALVAEERTEAVQRPRTAVSHQKVPVEVPDLVAEVAEQRAVRLVHSLAAALTLAGVGLGDVDGDEARVVARDHPGRARVRGVGKHVEQEALGVFLPAGKRQAKLQEGIEQAALGSLQAAPAVEVGRVRQVGNGAVVPAGLAEGRGVGLGHEPVAGPVLRVAAEPPGRSRPVERVPRPVLLQQRHEVLPCCDVAQAMPTALAEVVLEVDDLPTVLALEELHERPRDRR
jgi:hypothetical protein